jgi:hypothetical protein
MYLFSINRKEVLFKRFDRHVLDERKLFLDIGECVAWRYRSIELIVTWHRVAPIKKQDTSAGAEVSLRKEGNQYRSGEADP